MVDITAQSTRGSTIPPVPVTGGATSSVDVRVNTAQTRSSRLLRPRSTHPIRPPIDPAPRRRIPPKSHQVRQMPHRRPTVRAVPRLIHRSHVSYDLRATVQFKSGGTVRQQTTYRSHPRLVERLADHHAPPTGAHRKHGPRFRTAHRRPLWAILHEMDELLEVYRAVRSVWHPLVSSETRYGTLDVKYSILGHGLRDEL